MTNEENISIIELARRFPNLTVSISFTELVEAFRIIFKEEKLQNEILSEEDASDVLLTEKEVQKILNTSHSTLWRWHNTEYLVHVSIGRKNRYKKSDVDKILNNRSSIH
jgi:predicted DNA-binding transcriptional regulator AlpA